MPGSLKTVQWQPNERHWESTGLPRPFQARNQDFNLSMLKALEARYSRDAEGMSELYICGPDGITCSGSLGIKASEDEQVIIKIFSIARLI